jgi:hypothetical protein
MEKLPHSKYTKEFRLEAVRLVTWGDLSNRRWLCQRGLFFYIGPEHLPFRFI